MVHKLKTWREPFQAVFDGRKTHEFRAEDNRIFCEEDVLILQEFDHCALCDAKGHVAKLSGIEVCPKCAGEKGRYSGREVECRVTYISRAPLYGFPKGFVAMSILVTNYYGFDQP
jgi:hypothetical protein